MQRTVEAKSSEQIREADGFERWESYRKGAYQTPEQIAKDRSPRERERNRQELADALVREGSVALEACLAYSLEFNDRIQAQRAGIEAVGGEQLIVRSRFLPHVSYRLAHASMNLQGASPTNDTVHAVRVSQTLLEFGRDNGQVVKLRDAQRKALFGYEDAVRDVLAEVRKQYFTILLRERQVAERRTTLEGFVARHAQVRQLEEARRVREVDVLTARLNVLNEEARINALDREILRKKTDLLRLLGFPVGLTDIRLAGEVEQMAMPVEQAVELALLRSSSVAQARAETEEQARRLRDVRWEYAPNMELQSGWKGPDAAAGLAVHATQGFYNVSAFTESYTDNDRYLPPDIPLMGAEDEGWFTDLSVELPVFQGLEREGRYRRERALLRKSRDALRGAVDDVEQEVRKAMQTVLERRKEIEILQETVTISRERLRVQERLKELGEISDNDLESFRNQYFRDQDQLFTRQIDLIEAQEDLRRAMRYFEPLAAGQE